METKKGIAVSPGLAICQALVLESEDYRIPERKIRPEQVSAEVGRLAAAFRAAEDEIDNDRVQACRDAGESMAKIFEAHFFLLSDPQLAAKVEAVVRDQHRTAEYAVSVVMREYAAVFRGHKTRLFAERVTDLYDVEKRLLRHLIGRRREEIGNLTEDVVVVAHDLTPSQTLKLDRTKVKGFVTDVGGRTSHTAILARSLGMPAVVGLENVSLRVSGGDTIIIDGHAGIVVIRPDRETLRKYREKQERHERIERELMSLRTLPAETADGHRIRILGNIEFPHEVDVCIRNGAEGIGLYRTEFLYLGAAKAPTEEDQYQAYCEVIAHLGRRPVTIRTLDLGADKYSEHLVQSEERNPFLGVRSIRLCLQEQEMFKTQLRAILRASAKGDVRIMFPLITTVTELRKAKMLLGVVMEDLEDRGIEFDRNIKVGMMVEVPAAAIALEDFASEVSFFSVGTNDLVQYMLAVDRGNEKLKDLYQPANPAVLRVLRQVVQKADAAGIEISLCGEMGGDPEFTLLLLGLGFRILSVSAPSILEVKKLIRAVGVDQARAVAEKAFRMDNDKEIVSFLKETTRKLLPENF